MLARRGLAAAVTIGVLWSSPTVAQTSPPAAPAAGSPATPAITLAPVDVVGTSPLLGIGIDRDKVPANVQTLPAQDYATEGPAAMATSLNERVGSANLSENEDNVYQPDIQYRGFTASPVVGTPAGLAVYQNGVRQNEPFGDNLSWDLVPEFAIDRLSIIPTNPVYGLNALGGALVLQMKNGFTFQGGELDLSGGSFGQRQLTLQYGKQVGNFAAYIGINGANDEGFRKLSPASLRQLYLDIGAESERGSLHFSLTGANNVIDGLGPTPIQQVDIDRTAVFVSPQTFRDTLLMPSLNANYRATDDLSFQGNFYMRNSGRKSYAGNITDAQVCDSSIPDTLCFGDPFTVLFGANGDPVANTFGGAPLGENDVSAITSVGLGGSLQATYEAPLFGHTNHLVAGASIDHGDVDFSSSNELATVNTANLVTSGTGIIISQPDGSLTPVRLETTNSYYGVFASDTFDVTPQLSLTVGARYNLALIHLYDKIGTALNGESRYSRLNPAAGLTYKITPNTTAYVGYAEANRAPTPGEIGCSDPVRPCSLDAFVSADPPGLKQVVAHSYEVGVRGHFALGPEDMAGRVDWNLGLYRTDVSNDIMTVPSDIISTGFFQNIGDTRRQGIEAGIGYKDKNWRLSAVYSLVDATFRNPITLSSPSNPFADANGDIQVMPGDHLAGIPLNRVKLNADYSINDRWSVGGSVIFNGNQYYFGDESNQNPQLPGYIVVNLRTTYKLHEGIELFAQVKNLFDNKYATYGIFNDPTTVPLPGVANPTDPRFVSAAPPLSLFGGVRLRF